MASWQGINGDILLCQRLDFTIVSILSWQAVKAQIVPAYVIKDYYCQSRLTIVTIVLIVNCYQLSTLADRIQAKAVVTFTCIIDINCQTLVCHLHHNHKVCVFDHAYFYHNIDLVTWYIVSKQLCLYALTNSYMVLYEGTNGLLQQCLSQQQIYKLLDE